MFNNYKIPGLSIDFDMRQLHRRFKQGEVGKFFSKFMEDEKTIEVFKNHLAGHLEEKIANITDAKTLELVKNIFNRNTLWTDFQVSVMVSIFRTAVTLWLEGNEDLDKIIISLMTPKILIEMSNLMLEVYERILCNDMIKIKQCFVPVQGDYKDVSMDYDEEKKFEDEDIAKYFSGLTSLRGDSPDNKKH